MNNPIVGLQYFIAGFKLLTKPGIKFYVIIPLIINILFFIGLFFLLRYFFHEFNVWFYAYLPNWLHWLSYVLWFLFFISFFLVFIYTFVTIANIISAPFNSFLAEKVELYLTGQPAINRGILANLKDVPRILLRQLAVIFYYLPRALLFLILFFIPLVHFIIAPLWFLFNAWFMTLTYVDYPTDNHRISFKEMREWLKARRLVGFGFGIGVLIATMIPIINFFAMPAAVAGATKFWVEERNR